MKRSEYIAIGAVGLLAVATFWPRGGPEAVAQAEAADLARATGDGFKTFAFGSLDECKQADGFSASVCEAEFANVRRSDELDQAPKFDKLEECEGAFGTSACRPAQFNGASVFVPALAGVLIARSLMQPGQFSSQPLYPAQTGPKVCPPGTDPAARPECAQQRSSSSSGSGGGGGGSSSGRRYYSTGAGNLIGRVAVGAAVDAVFPSRSYQVAPTARTASVARVSNISSMVRSAPTTASSRSMSSTSSSTVSRSGFGSTSRSFSSGS
ncbi:MAG: DUF1190 domain-containing protein [Beijerinckiaceae bacterium]